MDYLLIAYWTDSHDLVVCYQLSDIFHAVSVNQKLWNSCINNGLINIARLKSWKVMVM